MCCFNIVNLSAILLVHKRIIYKLCSKYYIAGSTLTITDTRAYMIAITASVTVTGRKNIPSLFS